LPFLIMPLLTCTEKGTLLDVVRRQPPPLQCRFYQASTGAEPVRTWLRGLPREARLEVGSDVEKVQWRWPISKPLVGSFGAGLYEVRTSIDGKHLPRVLLHHRSSDGPSARIHEEDAKGATQRSRPRACEAEGGSEVTSKRIGSTLRSLFDELEETGELDLLTRKKVLADQIRAGMERAQVTQVKLASAMRTSRTVVHRLLDPSDTGVTLDTLVRASQALGLELRVSLRPPPRRRAASGQPRRAAAR
jgi:predicted XRE-type DNA-binding protein